MKIVYYILFIILTGFFMSCSGCKNQNSSSEERPENELTAKLDTFETQLEEPEDFHLFLEKFNHSEMFQMRRIKFPLPVIVPNMDDSAMRPVEDTITKYEWETIDLSYDSTYLTREYDQYYQVSYTSKDTTILKLRGVNNGIHIDYIFTLSENRWYLVSFKDASL